MSVTDLFNLDKSFNCQEDLAGDRLGIYLQKNRDRLDRSAINQIHNLQIKLKHHVFEIAALGLASCGKTAILNSLQGKKTWRTSPLHGTTSELNTGFNLETIALEPNSPKVQIKLIDTLGLDEVAGEMRAEIAIKAARQADLILFVTEGDLTRQELEIISQLKQAYKPILLVFNKVDLYPERDRQLIYNALQDRELQNLISTNEIIFTSANPLPRRVRIESDQTLNTTNHKSTEVWEKPATDINALKQKILDLLNRDGKSLLAINIMRSLQEIHRDSVQKQLNRFLPQRTIASGIFTIKAIAILISPSSVLDFTIGTIIDGSLIFGASKFLGYGRWSLGLSLSAIATIILTSINNHYGQLIWMAIATPWFIDWLREDVQKEHSLPSFLEELQSNLRPDSILHRLNFKI